MSISFQIIVLMISYLFLVSYAMTFRRIVYTEENGISEHGSENQCHYIEKSYCTSFRQF
jgi:hypothetical protein